MGIRASKLRFTNHVFLLKNHNLKFNVTRYSTGTVYPCFYPSMVYANVF